MHDTFGEVLLLLRQKKKISKRKLCLSIDIPTTTYGQYERGTNVPESPEVIEKLINFYQLHGPILDLFLSSYLRSTLSDRQKYTIKELEKIHSDTVPRLFDPEKLEEALKGFTPNEQGEIKAVLNDRKKLQALVNFLILNRS